MPAQTNIKTDFGAVGDGQKVTAILTIGSGSTTLTSSTGIWVPGDVGKILAVTGAGAAGGILNGGAIVTYNSATSVTLTNAAATALSSSSQTVEWGTDDADKFAYWNADALTWQAGHPGDTIELDIPAGRYEFISNAFLAGYYFAQGIKKLLVVGAGRSTTFLSDLLGQGSGCFLGAPNSTYATNDPNNFTGTGVTYGGARTATVAAGSTSVTLLDASQAAWFSVGNYAMMGGWDLQGFGAPQNLMFCEYVQITGVSGSVVSFTPALTNSYKSTWPCWNPGTYAGEFALDNGGPAALFPTVPSWDLESRFQDISLSQDYRQTTAIARSMTLHNFNVSGAFGIHLSQGSLTTSGTCDWTTAGMEFDKLVATASISGLTINNIYMQSPGVNDLTIDGCTLISGLQGTGRRTTVRNSNIAELRVGCTSYGRSDALSCYNNTISAINANSVSDNGGGSGIDNTITLSGGVITETLVTLPIAIAPGTNLFLYGQFDSQGTPFVWGDATTDGRAFWSNPIGTISITSGTKNLACGVDLWTAGDVGKPIYVGGAGVAGAGLSTTIDGFTDSKHIVLLANASTTLTTSNPDQNKFVVWGHVYYTLSLLEWPSSWNGVMGMKVHPCPVWRGTGNIGSGLVVDLNNAGAQGLPIFSYSKRTYNGSLTGSGGYVQVWGALVSAKFNVDPRYTGTTDPLTLHGTLQNGAATILADNSLYRWNPQIDMRTLGNRTVTPSSASTFGADAGLAINEPAWLTGEMTPYADFNIVSDTANWFGIEIEFIADQGIESETLIVSDARQVLMAQACM